MCAFCIYIKRSPCYQRTQTQNSSTHSNVLSLGVLYRIQHSQTQKVWVCCIVEYRLFVRTLACIIVVLRSQVSHAYRNCATIRLLVSCGLDCAFPVVVACGWNILPLLSLTLTLAFREKHKRSCTLSATTDSPLWLVYFVQYWVHRKFSVTLISALIIINNNNISDNSRLRKTV